MSYGLLYWCKFTFSVQDKADFQNVVGGQIFVPADAPRYHRALIACAICLCVNAINLGCMQWYYKRQNKRRDREFAESGISEEERELQTRIAGENGLTDKENKYFRYWC